MGTQRTVRIPFTQFTVETLVPEFCPIVTRSSPESGA